MCAVQRWEAAGTEASQRPRRGHEPGEEVSRTL